MILPFIKRGKTIKFYPVYFHQGTLVQDIDLDCDAILLMDYFGYTTSVPSIDSFNGVIIRDITQSLFSRSYYDADYYFGSLRKWCGIWTGGYGWTKDQHHLFLSELNDQRYIELRSKAMDLKRKYIEGNGNKDYLKLFDEAEQVLDNIGISAASNRDVIEAQVIDVEYIKSRHRANARVLMKAFPEWLIFQNLKDEECPMFVPIMVPLGKRDDLRCFLTKHEIYCPIHWPISDYHKLNSCTKNIYDNELSLVCDQRYEEHDMGRIIETINSFF